MAKKAVAPKAPTKKVAPARSAPAEDDDGLSGWQQRALDRSLVEAKRRALTKSNGFVRAAMDLLDETGGLTFTVQDVVDRSKLSLRSFYQTFVGKDDLLLALFEECVASAADWQRSRMAKHDDPIKQIEVFLTSLWTGKLSPPVVRALALYNLTLSATRPSDLADRSSRSSKCCSKPSSAASCQGRSATTSGAGGSPRSSSTPATPRCTPRSSRPAASRPPTSGRLPGWHPAPG